MTKPTAPDEQHSIYHIKVIIKDTEPAIWRTIQVPSHVTLYKMHRILQLVMGWQNSHLHEFVIDGKSYGESHPEYGLEMKTERRARLDELVPHQNGVFFYDYNLDDGWRHVLLVEKVLEREPGVHYPRCVAGERACPPEDCGGTRGYKELLEIVNNPEDAEYEETMAWLGGSFDPKAFDVEGVNQQLKKIR
ncbi:plasmid pRiA4b ORF-3 family protein [[Phormidium] sp. ETS-05]|uniref:plasmid pRiA4b ORF-3 family protein n=1 Tax=[Phormidium] sp. ETS-05 TaxID=222819 RepID=UPI0018EEEA75|nr:plasmid pRiA4b ORF-3 family protein [[Phormidium] sp. ETS-05]